MFQRHPDIILKAKWIKTISNHLNGLDSHKGIYLKNLWAFAIMLIWRDCKSIEINLD